MAEISKPDYTYLWSSGGATVAPSNVKIQTGWTAEVPPFQWENWSQNRQDQAIAHILQHGISVWDSSTEYQGTKSYVTGSNGVVYRSVQTNTGQNPTTDGSNTYWRVAFADASGIASESVAGIVRLANNTEVTAGTDATKAVSPARLLNTFLGAGGVSGSDYIKVPYRDRTSGVRRELIIQWGTIPPINAGAGATITFPLTFPTTVFSINGQFGGSTFAATPASCMSNANSTSSVTFYNWGTGNSQLGAWLAMGY